jgi:hypothetical protein
MSPRTPSIASTARDSDAVKSTHTAAPHPAESPPAPPKNKPLPPLRPRPESAICAPSSADNTRPAKPSGSGTAAAPNTLARLHLTNHRKQPLQQILPLRLSLRPRSHRLLHHPHRRSSGCFDRSSQEQRTSLGSPVYIGRKDKRLFENFIKRRTIGAQLTSSSP